MFLSCYYSRHRPALFANAAVNIVLRAGHDLGRKHQHADQVGDHHQAVEGIGDIPGELRFHDGAGHADDIAGAYRRGKCRAQRLELGDRAVLGVGRDVPIAEDLLTLRKTKDARRGGRAPHHRK